MVLTRAGKPASRSAATPNHRPRRSQHLPNPAAKPLLTLAVAGVLPCLLLEGCATVPSINVLGAYFPDWMFCIIGAVVVTSLLQGLLSAKGFVGRPGTLSMPLAYIALTAILALTGWLVFFNNYSG